MTLTDSLDEMVTNGKLTPTVAKFNESIDLPLLVHERSFKKCQNEDNLQGMSPALIVQTVPLRK
jgi:hypothetical protein